MFKWFQKQDFATKATLVLLVVIVVLGIGTSRGEDIPKPVVDWIEKNVVKIYAGQGGGSGFFVAPDLVVTACHVTGPWKTVYISPEGYLNRYPAQVLACDEAADLALLRLYENKPKSEITYIAKENPETGKATYGSGYPIGLPLTIFDGHWQRPSSLGYMNSTHVVPGDSGSPLLILEDGKVQVVGVRVSMLKAGESKATEQVFPRIAFIKDVPDLRRFLHENT